MKSSAHYCCQLPLPPRKASFIGSQSRIGVVGESSLLILHGTLGDEDDIYDDQMKSNAFRTRILCSHAMPFNARATDFEVISAQGKSFVACLANSSRGEGRIRLLELLSEQQDEAKLIDYGDLAISNCQALGGFSSLTFDVFSKILAISTESGEIIVWDMHLGKEIRRITADECGVTSLKFRNTESLISIGRSLSTQMKIWDIRSPSPSQPRAQFRHSPGLGFVDNGFASSSSAAIAYSCVRAHDAQEQVICGSSSGLVAKWDLRSSIVQTASLHEKKVTMLQYDRSSGRGGLLSCSADGTLRRSEGMGGASYLRPHSSALLSELAASICSLDYHTDTNALLACSSLGSLWLLPSNFWV